MFVLGVSTEYHAYMGIEQLAARINSVNTATAGVGELTSALHDLGRIDGWVSVTKAAVTRRLAELEANGHGPPAADVLARSGHTSAREAAKNERRAQAYGNVPELGHQREAGRISDEHADVLASAACRLDDDQRSMLFANGADLAAHAAACTPGQFAHHLRKHVETLSTDDEATDRSEHQRTLATLSHGLNDTTGMGWVRADLHPDDYQKFKAKLNAEVAALRKRPEHAKYRYDQLAAEAFTSLVASTRAAAHNVPEVGVLIDLATLQHGTHPHTRCEYIDGAPLPVATARRHACDANIIPIVLAGDGQPLDVGRARRHATSAQRTALRTMYRTCAVAGCETSFDKTEIHHLAEWDKHHGPTNLDNLLPICTYHHHRAHEGRWRFQLDPNTRQLTVHLPDGTLHSLCLPDLLAERDVLGQQPTAA